MKIFYYCFIFFPTSMLISCSTKPSDFTVKTPFGLTVSDSISASGTKIIHMHPPIYSETPIFVNNIIISIVDFPSLSIYRMATLKSLKNEAVYFEEKGKGERSINGYTMEWEHHIIRYQKSENTVEQKVYFVWNKGNIYQIVCTTQKNQMAVFQFRIDEVLNSFRILK